ncbi:MAG: hypothetical protein JNL50_03480 [Phycisphaerae bacterium]|nr:hypothetical protein [Phycisphaerae bacterium]
MENNHASSSPNDAGEGGAVAPGIDGPVLQGDVSCIKCSYNLRGLPPNRNCPECGEPIASSLKGFTLQAASAEYRATLKSGLSLVLNGILFLIMAMIAMAVVRKALPGMAWLGTILDGVVFLIGCAMLLGYWKYTEPDPGYVNFEQPSSARKVVRVSVLLSAVISLAQFMLGLLAVGMADASAVGARRWPWRYWWGSRRSWCGSCSSSA